VIIRESSSGVLTIVRQSRAHSARIPTLGPGSPGGAVPSVAAPLGRSAAAPCRLARGPGTSGDDRSQLAVVVDRLLASRRQRVQDGVCRGPGTASG
jgi:hypothetical protein